MTAEQRKVETVSLLQDLGLKEYEARSFLALTQLSTGTAKEISDISEVPRTRVYDAVRVLESRGLVEVQHGTPQQFRAVSIEEASTTLRQQFGTRIDTLESHLEALDLQPEVDDSDRMQEVWTLSGHDGIEARTHTLLEDAESEIVLLIVEEELLTEALYERLRDAVDRGVDVIIGGETDAIITKLGTEMPSVKVFETELDWLLGRGATTRLPSAACCWSTARRCWSVPSTRTPTTTIQASRQSSPPAWRTVSSSSFAG